MNQLHPIPLVPRLVPKAWGSELWLNATHPEGSAGMADHPGTFASLVRGRPEVLGAWSRSLFGDEMPVFAKIISTDFPARAHIGFSRHVSPRAFLDWLMLEHALVRSLHGILAVPNAGRFAAFESAHRKWAMRHALGRWREDAAADRDLRRLLGGAVKPGGVASLPSILHSIVENRARIVGCLNEVDLRGHEGHVLLLRGGVLHALFGLSHQTHPRDRTQAALQELLVELRERAAFGAPESRLEADAASTGLRLVRDAAACAPKSEAWLALPGRATTLAEVQQTADTTHSLCDFFTPFVWKGRVAFRKGDPAFGLSGEALVAHVQEIDFSAHRPADYACKPAPLRAPARRRARLWRLLDAPERWPFFTIHRLDLEGTKRSEAAWSGRPLAVFQHLVVLSGRVKVRVPGARDLQASPARPVFIPAALSGGYEVAASAPASVLIIGVPGPRPGP